MYQTSISPDRVLTSIIAWPRKSSDSRVSFCRSLLFRSLSSSQTRIFIRSVELLHSLKLENTIWNFCLFSRIITFKIILFICKCFARSGILAKSRTKHYGQEFRLLFQIGQSIPNRQNLIKHNIYKLFWHLQWKLFLPLGIQILMNRSCSFAYLSILKLITQINGRERLRISWSKKYLSNLDSNIGITLSRFVLST